jgi:hypothetical protein
MKNRLTTMNAGDAMKIVSACACIFTGLSIALAPNASFAAGLALPFFPPLMKLVPIVVLTSVLFILWRLKKQQPKKTAWFVVALITAVISSIIVLMNVLDLYTAKRNWDRQNAYGSAHRALYNSRPILEGYYREHKEYPKTPEELGDKIPHLSHQEIIMEYRLLSKNTYEIITRHEKWNDVEFMMRNDAATAYVRMTGDPNSEFLPEADLEKAIATHLKPSENMISEAWHILLGKTKKLRAGITVFDSETKKPLWGAKVILGYHKKMKDSERGRIDEDRECKGHAEGVTDRNGKIDLSFKVENCPTRGIEDDKLYLTVQERDYAKYQRPIKKDSVDVALERLGYSIAMPPISIEYPQYVVDAAKYQQNFELLNEMNAREMGDKTPIKSYFAWEYSHMAISSINEGFNDFLEKIEYISNINAIPLLEKVLENKYPLPYKRFLTSGEKSWRADDYIYREGHQSVAKALLNISDTRADELLKRSTDIPKAYVDVLNEYRIAMTADDYWSYLRGKYVSRAHNSMIGLPPSPDPLFLIKSKMKERLKGSEYAKGLFRLYQTAANNGADKEHNEKYNWRVDQKRLADDLFDLNVPKYTEEVKRLLPSMEANSTTRKYLSYLYKQREYAYLATALKNNKNLMKAFLAEDVRGQRSFNATRKESKDLEIEECLLPKMPKVAALIKKQIETYLEEASVNYAYYRWWIRNLALVNRQAAEITLQEIYTKASIEPYKENSKYEKRHALQGGAEGKLKGLCLRVSDDVQIRTYMQRDYFSIAKERINYLKSSCPAQFKRLVTTFNAEGLRALISQGTFEASYGYDNNDYNDSIWEGIDLYFPKERTEKIKNDYFCGTEGAGTLRIKCRNTAKEEQGSKGAESPREIRERIYRVLFYIVKDRQRASSEVRIYDNEYRLFFLGSADAAERTKYNAADWTAKLGSDKALPVLHEALHSSDQAMVRAGLYALSFYPELLSTEVMNTLREHVSLGKYPDYLYAAYSLSTGNPADTGLQGICAKAADYHLRIIESRGLQRFDRSFAFSAVLTLDLCSLTKEEQMYKTVLNALFEQNSAGRYDRFQSDIERIITRNNMVVDPLIEKLTKSPDVVDTIVGLRLAELKQYPLGQAYLEEKLGHDDSYVRVAAAKYVLVNKERYMELHKKLPNNTNRRVRDLAGE